MKHLLAFVMVAVVAADTRAEELHSGLQVGEFAAQFKVKDCTGPAAGKTLCYYCRYGERPVVSIFVRQLDGEVPKLVKQIDECVARFREQRLAAFVVVLGDDSFELQQQLKNLATEQAVKRTPLTIYRDEPEILTDLYRLSPQAAVTILMWVEGRVAANHAYRATGLTPEQIESVIAATAKILPEG